MVTHMETIFKLIEKQEGDAPDVYLGGNPSGIDWPKNPFGENLKLVLTIDNSRVNKIFGESGLPDGKFTSIFSTYSDSRYFLDDVVYFGDIVEFEYIKKGFTKVVFSDGPFFDQVEMDEVRGFCLRCQSLESDVFPAFSFFSKTLPNGMKSCESLLDEYNFVCQIYSFDIPSRDGGALGLSDAIGYFFIKKSISSSEDVGFFFVQTA